MGLRTIVKNEIYEESSWELDFDVFEKDGTTAVTPSSVKIYLYPVGSTVPPAYINDRDGTTKLTTGTWETYKGTGKLSGIKGKGEFKVTAGKGPNEFILNMEGQYEL